mgnify:CR=1 FL=1
MIIDHRLLPLEEEQKLEALTNEKLAEELRNLKEENKVESKKKKKK